MVDKKIQLTAGIFILLSVLAAGTTYFVMADDPVYLCEDSQIVTLCFKLSAVNDYGIQRNCYYNESAPKRYKICSSGWIEFDTTEFTGTEISINEKEFNIELSTDRKQILETYTPNLRLEEYDCEEGYKCYHLFSDKINRMYFVQLEIKNRPIAEIEKEATLIAKKNIESTADGLLSRQPVKITNKSIIYINLEEI